MNAPFLNKIDLQRGRGIKQNITITRVIDCRNIKMKNPIVSSIAYQAEVKTKLAKGSSLETQK